MMKILCLHGSGPEICVSLAESLSKELKRRRYQTAVWDRSERDPAPDAPEGAAVFLTNHSMRWPAEKNLEGFLPLLRADVLLICGKLPQLPYVECGDGPQPEDDAPDPFLFERVALDQMKSAETAVFLADRVVRDLPDALPFPSGNPCCQGCDYGDCGRFMAGLLKQEVSPADCSVNTSNILIRLDGYSIPAVRFVRDTVEQTLRGLLSTLQGYEDHCEIEVHIPARR
jgi:hypothetical protein